MFSTSEARVRRCDWGSNSAEELGLMEYMQWLIKDIASWFCAKLGFLCFDTLAFNIYKPRTLYILKIVIEIKFLVHVPTFFVLDSMIASMASVSISDVEIKQHIAISRSQIPFAAAPISSLQFNSKYPDG
jgi:hypothetical protein